MPLSKPTSLSRTFRTRVIAKMTTVHSELFRETFFVRERGGDNSAIISRDLPPSRCRRGAPSWLAALLPGRLISQSPQKYRGPTGINSRLAGARETSRESRCARDSRARSPYFWTPSIGVPCLHPRRRLAVAAGVLRCSPFVPSPSPGPVSLFLRPRPSARSMDRDLSFNSLLLN